MQSMPILPTAESAHNHEQGNQCDSICFDWKDSLPLILGNINYNFSIIAMDVCILLIACHMSQVSKLF